MAIDFKRLFDDLHIKHRDDLPRNWIHANCPFCRNPPDTHFNGGFNRIEVRYTCFRCGSHYYVDALSKIMNVSPSEVKNTLKGYEYITDEKAPERVAKGHDLELPGYYKLEQSEKEYLEQRGFDVNYLQRKFHIRGGGICGTWSYRILIPIYYNHILVSWTGRSILPRDYIDANKIPRYKNLSIEQSVINSKEIFFNLDNCFKDEVILVEGPMDVLRGNDNCICSLGNSVTREQELFLKKRFKKVFVAFDNEPAAQDKARHLGMNLSSVGLKVEVVNICEDFNKNDPGELTEEEMLYIKKELGLL